MQIADILCQVWICKLCGSFLLGNLKLPENKGFFLLLTALFFLPDLQVLLDTSLTATGEGSALQAGLGQEAGPGLPHDVTRRVAMLCYFIVDSSKVMSNLKKFQRCVFTSYTLSLGCCKNIFDGIQEIFILLEILKASSGLQQLKYALVQQETYQILVR